MQAVKSIVQLCFFRGHTSQLPYSVIWLGAVLAINFAVRLNLYLLNEEFFRMESTALALVCSYIVMGLFLYALLKSQQFQGRLIKTFTAYLGIESIFMCVFLVMFTTPSEIQSRSQFLVVLVPWMLGVKVLVLKQSMDTHAAMGLLYMISLEMLRMLPFIFFFFDKLVVQQGAI